MVQLQNLAAGRAGPQSIVRLPTTLPPEPALPAFHKLTRTDLTLMADKILTAQETAVFSAFMALVANRTARQPEVLEELRGSLAREIRGLQSLRDEFEGPMSSDDEPAKVDEDAPARSTEPNNG